MFNFYDSTKLLTSYYVNVIWWVYFKCTEGTLRSISTRSCYDPFLLCHSIPVKSPHGSRHLLDVLWISSPLFCTDSVPEDPFTTSGSFIIKVFVWSVSRLPDSWHTKIHRRTDIKSFRKWRGTYFLLQNLD